MKNKLFSFSLIAALMFGIISTGQAQQRKRKLSEQGRGAIIGGVGGAVAGGLIGKGAKGALIGGAIGAGGGYVIGNESRKSKQRKRRAEWNRHHKVVRKAKYQYVP